MAAHVALLPFLDAIPSPPSGRQMVEGVATGLGNWIWPFVGAIAFLETTIPPASLFVPGEWALLFAGAIAGQGAIPIVPLILLVWVASTVGDSFAFLLGRRFGRAFLLRRGARFGVTAARLQGVDAWFERFGPAAVALGRLVNFVRPLAPLIAGSSDFPYRRFLPWSLLGTALFSLLYTLLGYFFYRSYDELAAVVGQGGLAVLSTVIAVAVVTVGVRHWRGKRHRVQAPAAC